MLHLHEAAAPHQMRETVTPGPVAMTTTGTAVYRDGPMGEPWWLVNNSMMPQSSGQVCRDSAGLSASQKNPLIFFDRGCVSNTDADGDGIDDECEEFTWKECNAGRIGNRCTTDPECDTAPGAADGQCRTDAGFPHCSVADINTSSEFTAALNHDLNRFNRTTDVPVPIGNGMPHIREALPVPTDPFDWAHDPKLPDIPDLKGEVGASASLGVGRLWSEGLEPMKYVRRDVDQAPEEVAYVKSLSERQNVHFFEGDSRLTPWGRQVLGMFCADELRCLLDEGCRLEVDGYTDPKGSERSNKDLSEWRAQNVVQALMEIVGDGRFKAQLSVPEGHGEGPARRQLPDRTDDPSWRKVNVDLDHRVLLRLLEPRT